MAFVNTRDTIGDQATVDGLVEHSLTELKEDGIGILPTNALHKNDGLQSIEFPNIITLSSISIYECTNLRVLKIGNSSDGTNQITISSQAIDGCTNLQHVIIESPSVANVSGQSNLLFKGTFIKMNRGAIYVPENLVSSYKSHSTWKNFFIASLEQYPLSSFDTIEDSWSTIFSNASYNTAYNIKDYKTLELTDGSKIVMEIVAFDTDIKSDDSGKAKITWMCKNLEIGSKKMNETNSASGGWKSSGMRSYLISDILSKIPTEIKSHIVSVKKSYRTKSPNDETLWSDDEIWIPSSREVGYTQANYIESDGVVYSDRFQSGDDRIKYIYRNNGISAYYYWVRTAYSGTNYCRASQDTYPTGEFANYNNSVVFGFCTD